MNNSVIKHNLLNQEGYDIHYFIGGKQHKETIVFLHPAFGDHRCFDNQLSFFLEHYCVITLDMLGHGLSHPKKTRDKIDTSTEHLNIILEKESITSAHIVGVSMGSLIAQDFVFCHPQKALSLAILGGYNIHSDNREVMKAQQTQNIKVLLIALFSMKRFRNYISKLTTHKPENNKKFYEISKTFKLKSFKYMAGLGNIIKKRDNITYAIPVMIMTGKHDIELAKRISKLHHENIPLSCYEIITDAGHCANMDNPDEFNRMVFEFVRGN